MSAWLKRLDLTTLTAERWSLPRSGLVRLGRASDATFLLPPGDGLPVCDLFFDEPHWLVSSPDSAARARLGDAPVSKAVLKTGDEIDLGDTLLIFNHRDEDRNEALEQAIAAAPEAPGPWGVYADWLQERGDPLGLRIANGGDDAQWLEGLDAEANSGRLELRWEHGCIRAATLRAVSGSRPRPWPRLLAQLLSLRVSRFLRELVIDLPVLSERPGAEWVQLLAHPAFDRLPWPSTLDSLGFGYLAARPTDAGQQTAAELRFRARLPWLKGPLFISATSAWVEVVDAPDELPPSDRPTGRVPLGEACYLAQDGARFFFHTSPGLETEAVKPIAWFEQSGRRWRLNVFGPVRVNGFLVDGTWELLPGDEIDVPPGLVLRFNVEQG